MMRDELSALCKIQTGIDDARENVITHTAQFHDSMRANGRAAIRFGRVVTEFFKARDERFAQIAAAGDRAIARLPGRQPARRARENELPGHGYSSAGGVSKSGAMIEKIHNGGTSTMNGCRCFGSGTTSPDGTRTGGWPNE